MHQSKEKQQKQNGGNIKILVFVLFVVLSFKDATPNISAGALKMVDVSLLLADEYLDHSLIRIYRVFIKNCGFFLNFKIYSGLWPLCVQQNSCLDH